MTVMRKKSVQTVMALVLVAAIILAGTFAWFNFTQNAINIFDGFTNPDVNLHDDFWEPNKDVYVENSGQQPLYVRVRLDEWMQINGETLSSRQSRTPFEGIDKQPGWLTHSYLGTGYDNCGEPYHDYYDWIMGDNAADPDLGNKYYLPTPFATRALFDKDGKQMSEPKVVTNVADENGNASTVVYGTEATYAADKNVTMDKAYENLAAALAADIVVGSNTVTVQEHLDALYKAVDEAADTATRRTAQTALDDFLNDPAHGLGYYDKVFTVDDTGAVTTESTVKWVPIKRTITTEKIYTMAQWIAEGSPTGDFWIMDNDGWCYWGNILMPGQATGLLLSEVELNKDNQPAKWQYKINAKLQAVTFDDMLKFGETGENGGGGITDEGNKVLMSVSGDYAFDWSNAATGDTDPVYTFRNYKNNVYAQMTTNGTNITYGDRFIYTGDVPPVNRGELFQGDAGYKNGQKFIKNTTSLIGTGTTNTEFTVAADSLTEGANGDWYLKLTYIGQPADSDVYLAVGANRKFDALSVENGKNVSSGDDILIWVAKGAQPGTNDDRRAETTAAAGHKTGDVVTVDGIDFLVAGMETRTNNANVGKTLLISQNVLDVTVQNDVTTGVGTANITTTLQGYANAGTGSLSELVNADKAAVAQLLTIQDGIDYFANNTARAAVDKTQAPQRWWLSDGIVGKNGAFEATDADATDVGIRVAVWVDSAKLEALLNPPVAPTP